MDDPGIPRRAFLQRAALAAPVLSQLFAVRPNFAEELAAEGGKKPFAQRLSDAYGLDPSLTYLNHASIGTIPKTVQAAHRRYLEICEKNPWLYIWGGGWKELRAQVRRDAAQILGCAVSEVAFTHNTTEAFNLLAHGLPLAAGDEVLFSSLNHTGASACWSHMAKARGFSVRRFEFPLREVPGLTREDVVRIYSQEIRPETRVLVFPHVDNLVGLRHPVKELAEAARARGVRFVAVDGAQTVGMIPVNVGQMGVDVYATSGHKWIQAPKGLGLAYVRQEIQDALRPMWVTWGQEQYRGSARIYEDYGTRNLPELLAMGIALEFQRQLGASAKESHHRSLWEHARAAVSAIPKLTWRSPASWELAAALYLIEVPGQGSKKIFDRLFSEHGFVFRPFETDTVNAVRLSPNVGNSPTQLDRCLRALEKYVQSV